MKIHILKKINLLAVLVFCAQTLFAHGHHAHEDTSTRLKRWAISTETHPLEASFLLSKNDSVFLEKADGTVLRFPLADLSGKDQYFVREKMAHIEQVNQLAPEDKTAQIIEKQPVYKSMVWLFGLALLVFAALAGVLFFKKNRRLAFALLLGGTAFLCAFKSNIAENLLGTDPLFIDTAFKPFKPHVATRWDANWFYVESNGIPTTHPMMAGITKWQQQVPIQQCYLGTNAWQIPLNPELAATPIPVNQQHFLRGAVAIAANGIPIFNPYTNTGIDAFLDGQLDQWGGHCGRADDYHYHIAPMFLDTQTVDILPIAFALDGFAVYAGQEPDGTPMRPLDANHGHFDAAGVYHYHGTASAPYMIGNMVGKVTEDATLQLVPQPRATPVRPSLTPLTGATITNCTPNAAGNGYTLTYTRNGQTFQVEYSWTSGGVYTYHFISPTATTTETYNGHLPCEVPTATRDFSENSVAVQVFPNPSSGSIFLKMDEANALKTYQVQLFEVGGKLVFQKENVGAGLEVGGLARGVYVVKIKFDKGETCRKILVQ